MKCKCVALRRQQVDITCKEKRWPHYAIEVPGRYDVSVRFLVLVLSAHDRVMWSIMCSSWLPFVLHFQKEQVTMSVAGRLFCHSLRAAVHLRF